MLSSLFTLGAEAPQSGVIEGFKNLVNWISQPQLSLPFIFVPAFFLMLAFYRWWTRPRVVGSLAALFAVFYFGSMFIDHNYLLIISKPDNVPITMMLLSVGFCLWWAMRQAAVNDQRIRLGQALIEEDKDDKVLVWPDLVYTELICLVIASAGLILWSILLRAPLEAPANPAGPPNPSKAPWYFLGLQEMLVYYDPWMAGVVLPGMIITGLIALPYFDTNPKGNGYYTLRQRKFAITIWLFGFLILWVVLIVFGTFLRGPNWNFFGPYQYWDPRIQPALTNIMLSDLVWNGHNIGPMYIGLDQALPTNPFIREFPGIIFLLFWMIGLPIILAKTLLRRMYYQMGTFRYTVMIIHLVVMGLLPLKMVLRWLLVLKYFVYLPEFNFNV